jgi:hypothetical protein
MGIDIHVLRFLQFAHKHQIFGRVATFGRQKIGVDSHTLQTILGIPRTTKYMGQYCESLLIDCFGATSVDSYDYSAYDGATHIADFNKSIIPDREYDTVIDAGSSEHVYNVPQALNNLSILCRAEGQILHIVPANNFCGHGFWQFSPELFFSLYSEPNGYRDTTVFFANLEDTRHWYEVSKPSNGHRAAIKSPGRVYLLVRTRKVSHVSRDSIQQSDYVHAWTNKVPAVTLKTILKERIRNTALEPLARSILKLSERRYGSRVFVDDGEITPADVTFFLR